MHIEPISNAKLSDIYELNLRFVELVIATRPGADPTGLVLGLDTRIAENSHDAGRDRRGKPCNLPLCLVRGESWSPAGAGADPPTDARGAAIRTHRTDLPPAAHRDQSLSRQTRIRPVERRLQAAGGPFAGLAARASR